MDGAVPQAAFLLLLGLVCVVACLAYATVAAVKQVRSREALVLARRFALLSLVVSAPMLLLALLFAGTGIGVVPSLLLLAMVAWAAVLLARLTNRLRGLNVEP
jgi:ABC-type transport system involved in cytochrome c biogenesis permease subunit